jgi:hypothetical protein
LDAHKLMPENFEFEDRAKLYLKALGYVVLPPERVGAIAVERTYSDLSLLKSDNIDKRKEHIHRAMAHEMGQELYRAGALNFTEQAVRLPNEVTRFSARLTIIKPETK